MRQKQKLTTATLYSCFQIPKRPFRWFLHYSSLFSNHHPKATAFSLVSTYSHIFLFWVGKIRVLFWFSGKMADWAPVLIGVVLFVLLQPGLLFSFPGNGKQLEFGSMKTNGKAIFIHTLIFFALYSILILAVKVHIYTGWTGCRDLGSLSPSRYNICLLRKEIPLL